MWQRIQTLFLIVVVISLVGSIFLPIWHFTEPSGKRHVLYALHYMTREAGAPPEAQVSVYLPYSITAMFAVAAATVAFISIGKYKNRYTQMKLGAFNSLLLAGTLASSVYFVTQLSKTLQGGATSLGLWLPGAAVLCNLLANRFIRRDERIVKDSDRLR